jgi:peptidyl-prolyl cis-trans isomerase SurA
MMKKKYILSLLILLISCFESFSKGNIYIVYKIDNEIITNIDVEKEYRYLSTLNVQLQNLDKDRVLEIAKESALREKIKKKELAKYFNLKTLNLNIDNYLENFYKTLNVKNATEFREYLNSKKLTVNYIKKKIHIELLWNQLMYDKHEGQININLPKLKMELKKNNANEEKKIFLLSEIVFEKENNSNLEKKISDITQSIKEIGFNNTANIYSISDSSKFGGKIGWVEEEKLSKKIIKALKSLEIKQHSLPIQTGGTFLILEIEDIKYEKKSIDKKKELEKMVTFETNRQLEQFSKIYYKRIKINSNIDEL